MKTIFRTNLNRAIYLLFLSFGILYGCKPFAHDGITNPVVVQKMGYFYIADRGSNSLIMLDFSMNELKRWSLESIAPDTAALQGITFAGKNIWLAFSGNEKFIVKVDATGDTLQVLQTLQVPPVVSGTVHGTVRGIAYDGTYMWVVNSGSPTYTLAPTLYKIDINTDSVLASYPMPTPAPRGITYANFTSDVYGGAPGVGLYYEDNTTKQVEYFNNKEPLFQNAFVAPIPPAGTVYDQTLSITNDGQFFYMLSYSDIGSYLMKTTYGGNTEFQYKLPYKYPVAVVWAAYDIRTISPPSINSINPAIGARGNTVPVTVTGSDFKNGTGLSLSFGDGIIVSNLNYVSPTSLTASLTIAQDASLGKRTVTVTNPNGSYGVSDSIFTVTAVPLVEYLYITDYTLDSLFQIRLSDQAIVQSWSTGSVSTSHCHGLAYDGTNLWMAYNSPDYRIYKIIDMTTTLQGGPSPITSPSAVGTVQNLTYYNNFIWLLQTPVDTSQSGSIYKIDITTGLCVDTILTPGHAARGMAFANGKLYCNDRNYKEIFSCNPSVKSWSYEFNEPAPPVGTTSSAGMYFTGASFWIANSGGSSVGSDCFIEVSTTGTVIRSITAPHSGVATPSGIVYLTK